MTSFRIAWVAGFIALFGVLLLAGCASTRVLHGPPAHRPAARVSTPRYGATAVVHRGDTVYRIATGNGISPLDLAMWNSIAPPYTIHPGQRLRLYPSADSRPPAPSSVPSASSAERPAPPVAIQREPSPPTPTAAPASALAWRWPADGTVSSRYAPGEATRQGIDIDGREGAPVRAAADGVVVYSGSGLVGYGELVIVKHNDAWLSAYGHNRTRLVSEGQRVSAGQPIAEMGHTGASHDMLHFEIRYNGKPVDPLQYLPGR
jgi:lipoprotein NlpD